MQLLIKQRVFSWSDTYDIYDEQGNQKYFVKNEFISLGHRLHVMRRIMKLGLSNRNYFAFFRLSKLNGTGS